MIKIGDRVVCVKGHSDPFGVKKGREYIVYNITRCSCGDISFDIGILNSVNGRDSIICDCGERIKSDIWWHDSRRFRKVEEKVNYVKLEIEIEEPIYN